LVMMPMLRHILIVGLTSNLCYWHKVYNCGKKRNSFKDILIIEGYDYWLLLWERLLL
jgi:hypothetical protein